MLLSWKYFWNVKVFVASGSRLCRLLVSEQLKTPCYRQLITGQLPSPNSEWHRYKRSRSGTSAPWTSGSRNRGECLVYAGRMARQYSQYLLSQDRISFNTPPLSRWRASEHEQRWDVGCDFIRQETWVIWQTSTTIKKERGKELPSSRIKHLFDLIKISKCTLDTQHQQIIRHVHFLRRNTVVIL